MSQPIANQPFPRLEIVSSQDPDISKPPILCLHGSGASCEGWSDLAQLLAQHGRQYRVLLYDRGPENPKPDASAIWQMERCMNEAGLRAPFVLVAHSYGGAFAREFLRLYPQDVAGMVLVETGQETAIDPIIEEAQYSRQVMGRSPLSVIRGNSFIAKFAQLDEKLQAAESESERQHIRNLPDFKMLKMMDKEDERLKKRQLALSRNSRYVHVPDCGHGIVQARPDVVADEVDWVMKQLSMIDHRGNDVDEGAIRELVQEAQGGWRRLWRRVRKSQ